MCAIGNALARVRVVDGRALNRAAVAGPEGSVGERTVLEQTVFVRGHAVANLLGDRGGAALERLEAIKLRDRNRVHDPLQQLPGRNDPNILLLLSPVEELVDHVDRAVRDGSTRDGGLNIE